MPLILDEDRIPPQWVLRGQGKSPSWAAARETRAGTIELALLINMPDAALEDTESQFFELLDAASGDLPLHVKLYSLPELPRDTQAKRRLEQFYYGMDDLWNSHPDVAILTGTEPRCRNLRDEPYWQTLVDTLDWAERNTISTILSCLAVHAGVLHSDGIERLPLSEKRFGVFDFHVATEHFLCSGAGEVISMPHSRWNEIREDELQAARYVVLARSPQSRADSFVKVKRKSLTVHFQGHPEYHAETLLKEYRRDIRRFLKKEREHYPGLPQGYFDAAGAKLLSEFREKALADRRQEILAEFPEAALTGTLRNKWRPSATRIYRNLLQYVALRKAGILELIPHAAVYRQ